MRINEKLVPRKEVKFQFPTWYDDDGALGDKIWDELMPRECTSRKSGIGRLLMENCSWIWLSACPESEEVCDAKE